jgi:DNA-binding transcriptional LysR family regulator
MNSDLKSTELPKKLRAFRGVDLNLFVVFTAIYELRSVTSAAQALGLTQPAVSHALGRLREALGDELFIRAGNAVVPTPFTSNIIEDVFVALNALQAGPLKGEEFDPKSAKAHFRIAMPGGMEIFVLPRLITLLDEQAPNIKISTTRVLRDDIETELARGKVNLIIDNNTPTNLNIHRASLADDELIVAARKNNPLTVNGINSASYLAAKHILVTARNNEGGIEDYELARLDLKRNIAVRCAVLTAALRTAAASDYMVTLGRRQLQELEPFHNLATFDFPFPQPRMEALMLWHDIADKDPANIWLRKIIQSQFDQLNT